ncbi:hypothetical protein RhiJN_12268 [Ceratobasidium sp. AG-Ba]|nr:hypothetical protein RhiJN_11114 [Ceratobasidium sp. AG-Ba]QRV84252.1 hypothetical protein RhiJN_12268 [Ceratobasidium sp. AG-Ba]QRW12880.1 hypothetical protein RhiLY_11879 [Ceratobasidium sp. AG-Ba]
MPQNQRDFLETVPLEDFRDALESATFKTMVAAYKVQTTKVNPDEHNLTRAARSRRANRKSKVIAADLVQKVTGRTLALRRTNIDEKEVDLVYHPSYQSSEYLDAGDRHHRFVDERSPK